MPIELTLGPRTGAINTSAMAIPVISAQPRASASLWLKPCCLLPPVEGDGHHGPMGRLDSQGRLIPSPWPVPAGLPPRSGPILQAVHESGFETVWPISEPGPAVTPVVRFVKRIGDLLQGPGEGAGLSFVFFRVNLLAGSTPPGKKD